MEATNLDLSQIVDVLDSPRTKTNLIRADTNGLDENMPSYDAIRMSQMNGLERAKKRCFALFITLLVEMLVAFVISKYTDTLQRYPLLMAFMPVISAVSGNVGLQSSSIITRALATGLIEPSAYAKAIKFEIAAASYLAMWLGCTIAVVAGVWQQSILFGSVVGISQLLSIVSAAVTGSLAPLIGKSLRFDPTVISGPMETALQDIVGNSLFLILASYLLTTLG